MMKKRNDTDVKRKERDADVLPCMEADEETHGRKIILEV